MAMPLRCAASLRLAEKPSLIRRSLTAAGRRPREVKRDLPASHRLAAHRSGRAIAEETFALNWIRSALPRYIGRGQYHLR